MKVLKVILLLALICKSGIGFSASLDLTSGQSCCGDKTEIADHHDSEEEDKNCCNTGCDCLCCGHIFTFTKSLDLNVQVGKVEDHRSFAYAFLYHCTQVEGIWQPPRHF